MAKDDELAAAIAHLQAAPALLRGRWNQAVTAHFVELALVELGRPRPDGHGLEASPD